MPPAVGYSFKILVEFLFKYKIDLRYYPRIFIIGIINLINFPFRTYERLFINPRFKKVAIEKEPVFIIGHWRSGTTHLHNLLTRDQQMGYCTTYQGVFPDTLFNKLGIFLFKGFTRILIPATRKGDNVVLNADFPQEEEFALGDKVPVCFYYFWMFPLKIDLFYDKFLRFQGLNMKLADKWKEDYKLLIKKALKSTDRERFLSKNPPNTARIKVLLEMFPNAKFIFIHRNPVEVFLSTSHFFNTMMPYLQLQKIEPGQREEFILDIYEKMMNDYLIDKHLIPKGNLLEVSFADLEVRPLEVLESIYSELHLPGYTEAKNSFEDYINSMKDYKKNKHSIGRKTLDTIQRKWGFSMKEWNYSLPENIEIVDSNQQLL